MKKNIYSSRAVQLSGVCVLIILIMTTVSGDTFLTSTNFGSMLIQISDIGILTFAMAITMISGGLNLSIVSLANLTAIINAILIKTFLPEGATTLEVALALMLCVVVSIIIGIVAGTINGFLIANLKIPEILATLGTMNLFMGIATVITKGQGIIGFPELLLDIGSGKIGGFPVAFLIFAFIGIILYIVLHRTPFGSQLLLFGANRKASYYSGINNKKIIYLTYILSCVIASFAGIMIMARTNSATVDYGSTLILITLLIGVLSGISPSGGTGSVINIGLALFVMQMLNSGLNLLRVSNFIREMTPAVLLVVIMSSEYCFNARREERLNKKVLESNRNEMKLRMTEEGS